MEDQSEVTQPVGGFGIQILNPSCIIPVGFLDPQIQRDNVTVMFYIRD